MAAGIDGNFKMYSSESEFTIKFIVPNHVNHLIKFNNRVIFSKLFDGYRLADDNNHVFSIYNIINIIDDLDNKLYEKYGNMDVYMIDIQNNGSFDSNVIDKESGDGIKTIISDHIKKLVININNRKILTRKILTL